VSKARWGNFIFGATPIGPRLFLLPFVTDMLIVEEVRRLIGRQSEANSAGWRRVFIQGWASEVPARRNHQ